MPAIAELHLKANVLARYGLPDIAYPVAAEDLHSAISKEGELPLELLLFELQQRSRAGDAPWQLLEPAMDRLAELLAPDDPRDVMSAAGDTWWLEVGPVDLTEKLVTVQRGDTLIAAIRPREDGRLRIAAYWPLDAKSTHYVIGLDLRPYPVHGVSIRKNNWEYALDRSAGMSNVHRNQRDEACLSNQQHGVGFARDGTAITRWYEKRALRPRPISHVIAELGVHSVLYVEGSLQST
jgi:hypothetical protein